LDDITPEKTPQYYQKLTQGGSCVVVGTSPPSNQSSLVNLVPFPPNSGAVHEGLPDAGRKPVIYRSALVNKISETMKNQMSLLITSPSFTGKTSLANLMYNHWQKSAIPVHFISFAPLFRDVTQPEIRHDEVEIFFQFKLKQCIRTS
jgi:hypothetical protein